MRDGKPRDFVGIELQTLDTTGSVWPERQRFLRQHKVRVKAAHAGSDRPFGINWKLTVKTILNQLHHKITTFEHLCKRLVLVMQDCLFDYVRREFAFTHIKGVREGDPMQFHAYELRREAAAFSLQLKDRVSTNAAGIALALGLQADANVELQSMLDMIEAKLPNSTLLTVSGGPIPVPAALDAAADER